MSKFSGLEVKNVKRLIRHAIINHRFFQEKVPGQISHSALTAVLVNDPVARNELVVILDEFWPAGVMGGGVQRHALLLQRLTEVNNTDGGCDGKVAELRGEQRDCERSLHVAELMRPHI